MTPKFGKCRPFLRKSLNSNSWKGKSFLEGDGREEDGREEDGRDEGGREKMEGMNMIGRTTESAFQDARAVSLTQGELEKNNRIKTYFQKDDKIPNIDGYFETLGSAGLPLKRFAVQIKGKDKLEYRKTLRKYSYSADTGFFQYMLEGIESNPGMFFVAERRTGRVFFKELLKNKLYN